MPRTKKKAVPGKGFFDIVKNIVNPVRSVIDKIPGPIVDFATDIAKREYNNMINPKPVTKPITVKLMADGTYKQVGEGRKKKRRRRRRVGKGFLGDLIGVTGLGKKRGRGTITSENRKVMIT